MKKLFTLIEMLVVIVIIAILLSILLPSLNKAKYKAQNMRCVNNLGQMAKVTFLFAKDNKNRYPNRGWYPTAGVSSPDTYAIFRWAYRPGTPNGSETLYNTIGKYMSLDSPTWTCPLYTGTAFGSVKYGARDQPGNLTYSLHAGLSQKSYSDISFNDGNGRKYLGDPYTIEYGGDVYESRVLWSDSATGDNGPWALHRPGNIVRSNHRPPPGTGYSKYGSESWGTLSITGKTVNNFSYDDGSAATFKISNVWGETLDSSLQPLGDAVKYLIPID